ncbi:sugar ABC transporter substrate-binding protein [Nocardioides bruguierae]|uniref:sugar ABC transporter substrate-binding protein n=1 Tax=Nocardioides bruguierae TaxID=2945102 RepID=UPI00201FF134|nr:substrate-binding domain-containing protein [Nocardioides bruguierae]MCL8023949.1 substrate-binding domain-containing protein [Nocardioides bruguierae]
MKRRSWTTIGTLGIAAAALTLTACGSGTDAADVEVDTDALAAAQKIVDEYSADVSEDELPTGTTEVASDKLIVTVPCAYAAENCKLGVDSFADAADALGWTTKMIDPAGSPDAARAAIQTAINIGADGIFFMAADGRALADDLAEARDAGIVTVNVQGGENPDGVFDSAIDPSPTGMGRLLAAAITVQSEGTAKALLINDSEFSAVVDIHEGLSDGLDELCPSCTVTDELDFQIADLSTGLPTQVESALAGNPDTDVVWAAYDAAAQSISPVIERSANGDAISMVSTDGLQANLEDVQDGGIQTADVAASSPWMAWQSADLMNTLFTGGTVDAEVAAPYKLMTADTITTIPWDGDVDWQGAYETRWGVR